MVYITGRRLVERKGPTATVKVYSNASQVRLSINGKPLEVRVDPSADHRFIWEKVNLTKGDNQIVASATIGGNVVTDECHWTDTP